MPILNFKCGDCGKEFAKIFFDPETAPKACPVCGGANLSAIGQAFDPNARSEQGLLCTSCDTCETCGPAPSS
jgi:putative FmdB family regulatory protein